MLNVSKVAPPIVCVNCDGKGWTLEANPYSEGDVNWEECFVCNGLGRTHSHEPEVQVLELRWPHNVKD